MNKKQRVQHLERRVDRLIGTISYIEDIKDMTPCNRETFKKILIDLDEDWTEKLIKLNKKIPKPDDKQAKVHVEVAEVYSPPWMTKMADMMGMKSGFALDLTTHV